MLTKDAGIRAFRTFVQAFAATFCVLTIPALTNLMRDIAAGNDATFDVGFWRGVLCAACLAGVIAIFTLLQNGLEDATGKTPIPK